MTSLLEFIENNTNIKPSPWQLRFIKLLQEGKIKPPFLFRKRQRMSTHKPILQKRLASEITVMTVPEKGERCPK